MAEEYHEKHPDLTFDEAEQRVINALLGDEKYSSFAQELFSDELFGYGSPAKNPVSLAPFIEKSKTKLHPHPERHERYIQWLVEPKAVYIGHFELVSEEHSALYLRSARMMANAGYTNELTNDLYRLLSGMENPTHVFGPVTAGGLFVQPFCAKFKATAGYFNIDSLTKPASIRYGHEGLNGGKVLLVNDVFSRGNGMRIMARILNNYGAKIVGIALLATRGETALQNLEAIANEHKVPAAALVHLNMPAWPKENCQLCKINKARPVRSFALNA